MRAEGAAEASDPTALRAQLRHVYWIGGGSGSGKSTVARRLAAEHGLHHYSTDDVMSDHTRRTTAEDSPFLAGFMAMDMDERWVNRSPETMLETFHWFRGEAFAMIVEDLVGLPKQPAVVAEGFRLLPNLVKPLLAVPRQAVWLLPTPEFREAALAARGSLWSIAGRTRDPETALRQLLARDRMFTDRLRDELKDTGLRVIEVDTRMTVDALTGHVAAAFGLV